MDRNRRNDLVQLFIRQMQNEYIFVEYKIIIFYHFLRTVPINCCIFCFKFFPHSIPCRLLKVQYKNWKSNFILSLWCALFSSLSPCLLILNWFFVSFHNSPLIFSSSRWDLVLVSDVLISLLKVAVVGDQYLVFAFDFWKIEHKNYYIVINRSL